MTLEDGKKTTRTQPEKRPEQNKNITQTTTQSSKKGFIAIVEEKVAITLRRKVAITLKAGLATAVCYYPKSAKQVAITLKALSHPPHYYPPHPKSAKQVAITPKEQPAVALLG